MRKHHFSGVSRTACKELLSSLHDCPRALTCFLLLKYNEDKQLVSLDWDPHHYNDVVSARDSLLATKIASKATFLRTNIVTKEVARDAFLMAEEKCRQTNRDLRSKLLKNNLLATLYSIASRKIDVILGSFDIDETLALCGWGPGATRGISRRQATVINKFRLEDEITQSANDLFGDVLALAYPLWRNGREMKITNSNRVVTVPKNAKTDRTIAIEPGINLWLQKGVGKSIRNRLRRRGNDLRYQSHNQRLSRIGSKFSNLATIDFSMASDTVSLAVVEELLPREWYLVLHSLRAVSGSYDGVSVTYEKFSSMGNGFTFELETLIFYAFALACCEYLGVDDSSVSVYGDDVILPTESVDLFLSICEASGFTINKTKSYSTSYYRESCGSHFWNGIDVTPIYIKEDVNDEISLYKLANSIRRLAHRRNTYGCDVALRSCWQSLFSLVKHPCLISEGFGDGGFIVNFDEATPSKARRGFEGFLVKSKIARPTYRYDDKYSVLVARLYEGFQRSSDQDYTSDLGLPRDFGSTWSHERNCFLVGNNQLFTPFWRGNDDYKPGLSRYRSGKLLVPRWSDLGPWI